MRTLKILLISGLALAACQGLQARDHHDDGEDWGHGQAKDQGHSQSPSQGHAQAPQHDPVRAQSHGNGHSKARPAVTYDAPRHFRDLGIHRLPDRTQGRPALRESAEHSRVDLPHSGPARQHDHVTIVDRRGIASVTVHNHFREVMNDRGLLGEIGVMHRQERVAGRYYWHRWQDMDYVHYYDRWGYHWYGWYLGPQFFWVRTFGGRWWWYDGEATRWCFWFNGDWWWPDPFRPEVVYVYRDGQYISTDPNAPITSTPIPAPAGEARPTATPQLSPEPSPSGGVPYIDPKDMPPVPEEVPAVPSGSPEKI